MKVGDKIKILSMDNEPQYEGREGVIQMISRDPWGDTALYGTWGGLAVYPHIDRIQIIENSELNETKGV